MNMTQICSEFKISRQAHYQQVKRETGKLAKDVCVLNMVQEVRRKHPRMGTRKILCKITPDLEQNSLKMGRDELFELLRANKMLVLPRKRGRRTTIPGLYRTPNLLPGLSISRPNQVWVGDITYIDTEIENFVFLFLLMDLYSRFIVGYWVATSLGAEGAIHCLKMALGFQRETDHALIHHSDHGVQYTSRRYMKLLFDHHVSPSMGQIGNCYDNIFAERLIGTLKHEYLLGDRFVDAQQVYIAAKQSVNLYNTDRPHLSLKNVSPADVYYNQSLQLPPLCIPEEVQ
jgi:transposase InsO family protein